MFKKFFLSILLFSTPVLFAFNSLNLPSNLIPLSSPLGQKLFAESQSKQDFWPLMDNFVSEEHPTYCGVAADVMILNALHIPGPADPNHPYFHQYTQDNIFNSPVRYKVNKSAVQHEGMSLLQEQYMLQQAGAPAKATYGNTISLDKFRHLISWVTASGKYYMIAHFSRPKLNQVGDGHFSPIAAYNRQNDMVLILDVARYKYQPFWVKTSQLWHAMRGPGTYRGFVVVR